VLKQEPNQNKNTAKSKKSRLFRWLIRLGGTVLLLFLLWRLNLDPTKIVEDLRQANGWLVGLAVILVFPFIALKAWRWRIILKDLGMPISAGEAYRLYAVGLAAGSFTPGQAGDAIKAWYLREIGYPLSAALVSIILDRLFDLAVLLLLAAGGLLFLGTNFAGELPALLLLLIATLIAVLILALPTSRNYVLKLIFKLVRGSKFQVQDAADSLTPQVLHPKFEPARMTLEQGQNPKTEAQNLELETANLKLRLLPIFGATLLGSALALFRVWLLALALDLTLNPLQVVAVSSLATAVSLVPVSVGGIGARDITLVGILTKLGYVREKAISLSTLILLLNLVNLIVGYAIWFSRPNKIDKEKIVIKS